MKGAKWRNNLNVFLILLFSFFLMFKPFETFLVDYLTTVKRVPLKIIIQYIFPVWTYVSPVTQIVSGVLSDSKYCGHKWVLFFGATFGILSTLLVIFEFEKFWITVIFLGSSQVCFALFFSAHSSFFGLRYHLVEKDKIQLITSLTRALILFGHMIGNIIGQTAYFLFDFRVLPFIGIIFMFPLPIISFFLPSQSNYLVKRDDKEGEGDKSGEKIKEFFIVRHFKELKELLLEYLNFKVFFWSIFSLVSYPVHSLILTYVQAMFKELDPSHNFNGIIFTISFFFAGIATLIPSFTKSFISKRGEFIGIFCLTLSAICLIIMGYLKAIFYFLSPFQRLLFGYFFYTIYHVVFEFMTTCSYAQIASKMKVKKFASIFAFNNFLQVLIQITSSFIAHTSQRIFLFLGGILLLFSWILAILYISNSVYSLKKTGNQKSYLQIN